MSLVILSYVQQGQYMSPSLSGPGAYNFRGIPVSPKGKRTGATRHHGRVTVGCGELHRPLAQENNHFLMGQYQQVLDERKNGFPIWQ